MTDEQVERQIEIIKSATKEASKSKETAIKFLRDAGILKDEEPFDSIDCDELLHAKTMES